VAQKFSPVWGSPKGRKPAARPGAGAAAPGAAPAAAPATADAESGTDASDDLRRSLRALDVMRGRGLIDEAEYEARRRDLLGPG
jgi:hypothetical protein